MKPKRKPTAREIAIKYACSFDICAEPSYCRLTDQILKAILADRRARREGKKKK